ncbi:MAG: sensor histidine kinase [Bacteroidota bacterium]|nr:sensor histidine kinase [Bacteroidota bacterium]
MEKKDVIFAIIFTTIVLLLLVAFLFSFFIRYRFKNNAYLKEKEAMNKAFERILLQSQIEVQEATFLGLSHELHDNIGQLLSSTKMFLGITQRNLPNPPETLNIAEETLGKAINELRSLSKSLDKEWLEQFDFIQNLKAEAERVNQAGYLQILFTHPDKLFLKPDKQIILFRIVQEAIQNAIKHAQAKNIQIKLTNTKEIIRVDIIDDGIGFDETLPIVGLGMRNMKQRSKFLGGTATWNSKENGSSVTIELPFKENE